MQTKWTRVALAVAGGVALASSAYADVAYVYDDGTMDTAVGPPGSFPVSPQTGWGNYFEAEEGGEVITSISIAFGPTFPNLGPVTAWLFDDPDDDFNPGNAIPLTSTTLTPQTIGGSVFTEFEIDPTQVSGGFFVLALADTVKGEDRPAAQDTSGPTDRSWLIYNPATLGVDVNDLDGNALFQPAAAITPFDGVWMIRATGAPIPEPTSAAVLALGVGALTLRRRR